MNCFLPVHGKDLLGLLGTQLLEVLHSLDLGEVDNALDIITVFRGLHIGPKTIPCPLHPQNDFLLYCHDTQGFFYIYIYIHIHTFHTFF
jgi:hypothetical protein